MSSASTEHKFTNHLADETSPYLLQHAHNPVEWYPWGEQALARSKAEDKPIFLSIGYAACHWCHVMERESFENEATAKVLNDNFICIKVDREERPDLDEIYMMATQMVTGSGGWPMSVWLTPDLKPYYAGTYFPPDDRWGRPGFPKVLLRLSEAYRTDRGKVEQSAKGITQMVEQALAADTSSATLSADIVATTVDSMEQRFDPLYGGFGGAPKFPHTMDLMLLLRSWRETRDPETLKMVDLSLDKMARGGMNDQLGGGFHRYSVDERWLIPHFEKMLYDNALLARTYLEAYQATANEQYAKTARETLDYVVREMQSPEGGYYSSTDADSEGEEGKYFVWSPEEIKQILAEEDARIVCEYFDVRQGGNFEHTGKSVLWIPVQPAEVATQLGLSLEAMMEVVERSRPKLLAERVKRIPPGLDDKILTDWNGLMIGAMAFGAFVLSEPRYLESATRAASSVLAHQWDGDKLLHTRRKDRSHLEGMLSDYACLVEGMADLYKASLDAKWLKAAIEIHRSMVAKFWDTERGGFFNTLAGQEGLILRTKSANDGATPSGNSVAACNCMTLAGLTGDTEFLNQCEQTLKAFGQAMRQAGPGYPQLLISLDYFQQTGEQLVLAPAGGEGVGQFLNPLRKRFAPYLEWIKAEGPLIAEIAPLAKGKTPLDGKTAAYLCRGQTCLPPLTNPEELLTKLK
jgi:hypothetical protein